MKIIRFLLIVVFLFVGDFALRAEEKTKSDSLSQFVSICGNAAKCPGRVPYTKDLTLMCAIAAAGGFDWHVSVCLIRNGEWKNVNLDSIAKDPTKDISLKPGDVVSIEWPR